MQIEVNLLIVSKSFATENAYRSHVQSKKHREREAAYGPAEIARRQQQAEAQASSSRIDEADEEEDDDNDNNDESENEIAPDDDETSDIEERLAASRRRRFLTSDCLFCPKRSRTIEESLKHMTSVHSFFIPDRELLVDLPGLLAYLGEKVLVGNICLYCPGGGKEFGDVESARNHMVDKGHCKIAFETDEDRAELADFFNFEVYDDDEAWEDLDEEGDQDMEKRVKPFEV